MPNNVEVFVRVDNSLQPRRVHIAESLPRQRPGSGRGFTQGKTLCGTRIYKTYQQAPGPATCSACLNHPGESIVATA